MAKPERLSFWRVIRFIAFMAVVALFLFVSSRAGIRGVGILMLIGAAVHMVQRRIPYGLEGYEHSGYITGVPAILLGLLAAIAGILMLIQPEFMLSMLGW
jgi:hypothetical protein